MKYKFDYNKWNSIKQCRFRFLSDNNNACAWGRMAVACGAKDLSSIVQFILDILNKKTLVLKEIPGIDLNDAGKFEIANRLIFEECLKSSKIDFEDISLKELTKEEIMV